MKHAVVYIFLAFGFLTPPPRLPENLDSRGRSLFSAANADVLNYVCLPGIGVGDSCWEKRGGVRGGLGKGRAERWRRRSRGGRRGRKSVPPLVIAASGEQAANCSLSIW